MHRRKNGEWKQRKDRGNTILEFAIVMCFLVPMFTGAFTIGMAVTKGIQVSNVARDAVVLMLRAITDPNVNLDLSQTQNQRIIVRAAKGLGMNADAQSNPSPTGKGVVILSKVILVGGNECSQGIVPAPAGVPVPTPWSAANCPNFNSYVFAYRVVIGNGTRWASVMGNPGAGVTVTNGTISPSDIASNTAARVSNFTTATGMTLTQSTYALFSEMYADISYLNFFSVLPNPIVYVRSVS
jgi:hypothetical protein